MKRNASLPGCTFRCGVGDWQSAVGAGSITMIRRLSACTRLPHPVAEDVVIGEQVRPRDDDQVGIDQPVIW